MNTDYLIEERTYHHSHFWDLRALVKEKERKNLKISLCLPTLNEEATIGKEIVIFKSELKDRYPLLDEIAVVDSGSDDRTLEIAQGFGASVYLSSDCLSEEGNYRGKGENLWKALYLLDGDIIVYIDADIRNVHPRFVYGLLGPLIYHDEVQYVKAFYDRPITTSKGLRPTGGGRVTEILVRPLFNIFYPELTAILQPLSGEYAGRRSIFEKIPFPIGYGVETGMLIDIYRLLGIRGFAQTDLDKRIHRNQTTRALGRMAFGILQAFLRRAENDELIKLQLEKMPEIICQFGIQEEEYKKECHKISEMERKPILEVEAYLKKFYGGRGLQ